jgi:hypothetical protein
MRKHKSTDPKTNFAEALIYDVKLINNKLLVFGGNICLIEEICLNDFVVPKDKSLSHCIVVFEITTLTFDYDESRNIPLENRNCIGGVNILTGEYFEIWLNYKNEQIFFDENLVLRDFAVGFSKEEIVQQFNKEINFLDYLD